MPRDSLILIFIILTIFLFALYDAHIIIKLISEYLIEEQNKEILGLNNVAGITHIEQETARYRNQQQKLRLSSHPQKTIISGWDIVNKAYNESFAVLDSCPMNETYKKCLSNVRTSNHGGRTRTTRISDFTWPWWFQTLVRDGSKKTALGGVPLHGHWHQLDMMLGEQPALFIQFCVIESVGTEQWRKLQCKVNNQTFLGPPCSLSIEQKTKAEAARINTKHNKNSRLFRNVVFLRDPLERFLSGFIDKCIMQRSLGHCEPKDVFLNNAKAQARDGGLVDEFLTTREKSQQFFEAYVDTMPLKWNMHFFPLSMYCNGLGRHIQSYDFVGYMGTVGDNNRIYHDIAQLGKKFGGGAGTHYSKFETQLNEIFHYQQRLHNTTATDDYALPSELLQQYFTAKTIKRLLMYYSIDYVKLNLPIPEWAEEILATSK